MGSAQGFMAMREINLFVSEETPPSSTASFRCARPGMSWPTGARTTLETSCSPTPACRCGGVPSLHNLEHQNKLIEEHGLAHYRVDDPTLVALEGQINASPVKPGP